jgi:hypothetical protein
MTSWDKGAGSESELRKSTRNVLEMDSWRISHALRNHLRKINCDVALKN